jgi:hypothetical protein
MKNAFCIEQIVRIAAGVFMMFNIPLQTGEQRFLKSCC